MIARQRVPADELYGLLPLARREVLDLIARELKQNRFFRSTPLPPLNDDRSDFVAVRGSEGFTVHEVEGRLPELSRPEVHSHLAEQAWRDSYELAGWLQQRVEAYRKLTLDVARLIGAQQQDFFAHGPAAIAPLRVRDLATALTLRGDADVRRHFLTTIPVAVSNKTLETDHGRFVLDSFLAPLDEADRPPPLRERDRAAMAEDLTDLAKMAGWAEKQGIEGVAVAVRG